MLIGELDGAVSTDRLKFEAYKEVEQFDFVTVKNPKEGQEWILAQVDTVTKHPDGKTEAEAAVIGFRENGLLKQPRYVVDPEAMVYQADEDVIAETLGLTTEGLYMGRLDTNSDIRIFIDPEELYKHIAVLAKTGAGKSYATGVMIEELLEQDYPVLIVDPHGEYHSLRNANGDVDDEARERYDIAAQGYPVTEFSPATDVNPSAQPLAFRSTNLAASEIEQLVPTNLTNSQLEVLYNALKSLKKEEVYDLDDVVDTCMSQDSKAKWNLVNMLEVVQESQLFKQEQTPMDQLLTPGEATIVNLKGVDPEEQEMAVYLLAKELFQKRKVGELQPFIMVLEEAHNFVPEQNFGKAVCSDVLRTIASEGRKFGLGMGVISQRPARVDKNILSQCNTQLILRVTNPNDLNAISRSFEGVTSQVKDYITSLPPGTALLLGKEYPVMTDIRTRRSQHGGEAKELSDEAPEEEEIGGEGPEDAPTETEPDAGPADAPGDAAASTPIPDAGDEPPLTAQDPHRDPAPDTTEEPASGDAAAEAAVEPTIERKPRAVKPVLDREKLEEQAGSVQVAYYPLFVATGENGRVAIDGTDGEVKAEDVPAESSDDPLFTQETEEKGDGSVIETGISDEEAIDIAAAVLDGPVQHLKRIYYPYYTANNRVFDAVRGEEV